MSRDDDVRNINNRRRNILLLIHNYLNDNGYYNSASSLATEAHLSDDMELCDNVDLDSMYLEYASYYQIKFGKYPKFLRKCKEPPAKANALGKRKNIKRQGANGSVCPSIDSSNRNKSENGALLTGSRKQGATSSNGDANFEGLEVVVTKLDKEQNDESEVGGAGGDNGLKSLQEVKHGHRSTNGDLLMTCQEWNNLAKILRSSIVNDANVKLGWSDMCGNRAAVDIIKEAVLAPIKYPQLFENGLKPWRSVLLHGPPGSGKTMLAKVLYAESRETVTFFNMTSSMVISKWRGESEKLLKVLFHLAQKYSPSVIFLDEIEGLTSKRDRGTDHESSKRFKNELLQLMDGLEQSSAGVFILASTNLPWEIDDAFLRRFEKKLLVQLPNELERALLINKLLPMNVKISEVQMRNLVKLSHNFTGDEIRLACKEIAMQAIRRVTQKGLKAESSEGTSMELAFENIKPMSTALMEKHIKWQNEHGS